MFVRHHPEELGRDVTGFTAPLFNSTQPQWLREEAEASQNLDKHNPNSVLGWISLELYERTGPSNSVHGLGEWCLCFLRGSTPWYSFDPGRSQGFQAHLTRSMTRSLGAELTGSSLIMMISSPGNSFPSDGPPTRTHTCTDRQIMHEWISARKAEWTLREFVCWHI